jgi:uncharacterized membrane protein (UPF0127 family)
MRWQKKRLRVVNSTRGTLIGDSVRLADSGLTRIVGLAGERMLPPGDGLLIVPSQGVHTLGLLFAIDVIVVDGDLNVIAVRRAMRPFQITCAFANAAAVLELPAGTVDLSGTAVGDTLEFSRARGG